MSKRTKTTSWLFELLTSQSQNGTNFCSQSSSLQIFFILRASIQNYLRARACVATSNSTKRCLHLQEPRLSSISNQISASHGPVTVKKDGALALPWNIVAASNITSHPRPKNVMQTPQSSSQRPSHSQKFQPKIIQSKLHQTPRLFFKIHPPAFPAQNVVMQQTMPSCKLPPFWAKQRHLCRCPKSWLPPPCFRQSGAAARAPCEGANSQPSSEGANPLASSEGATALAPSSGASATDSTSNSAEAKTST